MAASAFAGVTLSDEGRSQYRIVVPAGAIPAERYAADELQHYLEKMSGAKIPITTDAEKPASREIVLGDNRRLAKSPAKIDFGKLGPDGICAARRTATA